MCNEPDAIEEIKGKYYTGWIYRDPNPQNPRDDSHLGMIVTWHKRYDLGDVQPKEEPGEWQKNHEMVIILPVYLYDHSGLSISTRSFIGRAQHAEWDSGQLGFICTTRERILEYLGKAKLTKSVIHHVARILEEEVAEYDQYIRGDVYEYTVKDKEGEIIDSCGGFFGLDFVREECKHGVEFYDGKQQDENDAIDLRLLYVCGVLHE